MGGGSWDSRVSVELRGTFCVGVKVFGDVVVGEVRAVDLVLFEAFCFWGFDVDGLPFLSSGVVLICHLLPYGGGVKGAWAMCYVGEWYVCMSMRIFICVLNVVCLWGSLDHGKG